MDPGGTCVMKKQGGMHAVELLTAWLFHGGQVQRRVEATNVSLVEALQQQDSRSQGYFGKRSETLYILLAALHYQPIGQWKTSYEADIPPNAVPGGTDKGGETIFVGRAIVSGDVVPGKVVPSHATCYVPYGDVEHRHAKYQVLVSDGTKFEWVTASGGSVPSGAIQGGNTKTGERLYIGRVFHDGTLTIGKVHPSHKSLYIPYNGKEHRYEKYEVLVCKTVDF